MLFRADHRTVDLADLYRGQTLFLVLNGASLQDFDFDRLKQPGICSMGVNNGAHGFRPQFWTCVDDPTRFLDSIWRDPAILKFVPQGHFDKPIRDPEKDRLSNWKVRVDWPGSLHFPLLRTRTPRRSRAQRSGGALNASSNACALPG